ncbi:MAG: hypothetical protein K2Z81_28660, partial [Cyanobacteria bacterium]|nr:hypothetical protein [Cyanobacteriota bacterium]
QYMDFVRNRTFRQTLLCRADLMVKRDLDLEAIRKLYVACPAAPTVHPNLHSHEAETFVSGGCTFTTATPLVKAAFLHMHETWPRATSFEELLIAARARLSSFSIQDAETAAQEEKSLARDLLLGYGINLVAFRSASDRFSTALSNRPEAIATARLQVESSPKVTSLLHESVELDLINCRIVQLLDGTRELEEVVEKLVELVKMDKIVIHRNGVVQTDENDLSNVLRDALYERLPILANIGLLAG